MSSPRPANGNGASSQQASCRVELTPKHNSGWKVWREKDPKLVACILFLVVACIVIVAVVPPVCVLKGCGAGGKAKAQSNGSDSQVNRLIVAFDQVGKTVRSKIPPWMYDYIEELSLRSGIQIVSFANSEWLERIQRILEAQEDLQVLLRDAPQYKIPEVDPWSFLERPPPPGRTDPNSTPLDGSRRRSAQQQQRSSAPRPAPQAVLTSLQLGDELADKQWANFVVHAPQAWNISQGANVVVAVIDTGCDVTHPDLKDHLWTNPREFANNGIDDDRNGYVDDIHGYDFAGACADTYSKDNPRCGSRPTPQDIESHGTHCTGIVAAVRNNRVGIAGIAPNVSVMCLKVVPNDGAFYSAHIFAAIDYAVNNGAHIISCSFGPSAPNLNPTVAEVQDMANQTALYERALANVTAKNMLLVAAAGNENTDLDQLEAINSTYHPCTMARRFPDHVICVMATNDKDQRLVDLISNAEVGTNYGRRTVDIGAPGLQILSTVPKLDKTGYQLWANKTGSSMATPLVAGIGALIMSVLGTRDGNFYLGKEARTILIESADKLDGLPAVSSSRVNAVKAVEQAYSRLQGILVPVLQADFSMEGQSVLTAGFNETYYRGAPPVDSIQWDPQDIMDASTRASRESRFDGFKQGAGTTVVVRASMNLSQPGLYLLKVNTTANPADLLISIGQVTLQDLSPVHIIRSSGGWYVFELRYRNPSAVIDITMAEPDGGGAPKLSHLPVFFVSTPVPPWDYYYAPSIGLSSAFQVLSRPAVGVLNATRILPGALDLNQPFNFSAVVEDISFTTPTALRDALYPPGGLPAGVPRPTAVVGIAHSRLRAPRVPMRFMVTCSLCALYVNTLRVVDVYDPKGGGATVTQLSNCIQFGDASGAATHDLTLRFGANNTGAALLLLTWLTCDSPDNGDTAVSVTTHTVSNLLWRPDSGTAGYVSGMQCDVWPSDDRSSLPPQTAPLIKFRLPTALAQARQLATFPANTYTPLQRSGCSANETAAPRCNANVAFFPKDILTRGLPLDDSVGANVDIRCWTFVNGGFRSGTVQAKFSVNRDTNAYLGAQTVFQSTSAPELSRRSSPLAPNVTLLGGYYQLLVLEWRKNPFDSLVAVYNGTGDQDFLTLDTSRTLLPFPVLPASGTRPAAFQTASIASTTGHRRLASAAPLGDAALPSGAGDTLDVVRVTGGDRHLQQQQPQPQLQQGTALLTGGRYDAGFLGASPYSLSQVPASPGLVAAVLSPNRAYTDLLGLLNRTVLYNMTLGGAARLATITCNKAPGGLYGVVCDPPTGRIVPRYVQVLGFIRVPAAALLWASGSNSSAGGAGAMAALILAQTEALDQSTAINLGGVTVRNGVDFPAAVMETETVMYLPRLGTDLYLPAVVASQSRRATSQARYEVSLLNPWTRAAVRVDRAAWYSTAG